MAARTARASSRPAGRALDPTTVAAAAFFLFAALAAEDSEWASATLATLRTKSPQACKVSLRIVHEGRTMPDFAAEMAQEYAVATRVCRLPDFAEGVRAVIVDKDNAPKWDPATPEGVSDELIESIFAPLPADEEWKPI